jgi:DNA-directed RNA polymerase specialized sigma24 family protein
MTDDQDSRTDGGQVEHAHGGESPTVEHTAGVLAAAGLLTERQAHAYLLREVEGVGRQATADRLGVSTSTLDSHLAKARRKVNQARETVGILEDLEDEDA